MEKTKNNLLDFFNKIKYPCITEKAVSFYENQKYTFFVDRSLNKYEIKALIENIFNVKIINVNTCNLPPKKKRVGKFIGKKSSYKKTLITLKKGHKITELLN